MNLIVLVLLVGAGFPNRPAKKGKFLKFFWGAVRHPARYWYDSHLPTSYCLVPMQSSQNDGRPPIRLQKWWPNNKVAKKERKNKKHCENKSQPTLRLRADKLMF